MKSEERTSILQYIKIILKSLLDLSGSEKRTASIEQQKYEDLTNKAMLLCPRDT